MNSWRDRDLKHSVALLAEQEIGVGDPIERKPVGEQRSEVHAPSPHQFEEPAHTFLPTGAQRGHDTVVAETSREGIVGYPQLP